MTNTFLEKYKTLVTHVNKTRDSNDLIKIWWRITGGQLLPQLVFKQNGQVRTFTVLQDSVKRNLSLMIKEHARKQITPPFLLLNLAVEPNEYKQLLIHQPKQARRIRAQLLQAKIRTPSVYFESDGTIIENPVKLQAFVPI